MPMNTIIDMHSHLDFAHGYIELANTADQAGIAALCSTTTPASFVSAQAALERFPHLFTSLGLHPWWIANAKISQVDFDRFDCLADTTGFIGEVGLDLGIRHKDSIETQIDALDRIFERLSRSTQSHLITIHAVKSADIVLDKLDAYALFENNKILFHWFSGTERDFGRACAAGCFFSVGMKMLATKAGRRYAEAIPDELLLLESDCPQHEGSTWTTEMWRHELDAALTTIADLREERPAPLNERILARSNELLTSFAKR